MGKGSRYFQYKAIPKKHDYPDISIYCVRWGVYDSEGVSIREYNQKLFDKFQEAKMFYIKLPTNRYKSFWIEDSPHRKDAGLIASYIHKFYKKNKNEK